MLEAFKVAAYLDEAGEDPATACKVLKELNIHYAVLRRAWVNNILELSDRGCKKLRDILEEYEVTPIALITTLGEVPAPSLVSLDQEYIQRAFNLASYFKTPIVRIQIGTKVKSDVTAEVDWWMEYIKQQSIAHNISPVFEITPDSIYIRPTDIAALLAKHRKWQLLYDPVQLILKQKQDPFVRFWSLLKNRTAAIDVRDHKIGRGFKPVGFGDSNILLTLVDVINTQYKGWLFLEPNLGRRHGSHNTKEDVFKMSVEAIKFGLQSKLGVNDDKPKRSDPKD